MSNSARIWIGYALMALPMLMVPVINSDLAELAFAQLERLDANVTSWLPLGCFITWGAAIFAMQAWARCWRCDESVFRIGERLYGPIVLQTRCVACGVKHASKPENPN